MAWGQEGVFLTCTNFEDTKNVQQSPPELIAPLQLYIGKVTIWHIGILELLAQLVLPTNAFCFCAHKCEGGSRKAGVRHNAKGVLVNRYVIHSPCYADLLHNKICQATLVRWDPHKKNVQKWEVHLPKTHTVENNITCTLETRFLTEAPYHWSLLDSQWSSMSL